MRGGFMQRVDGREEKYDLKNINKEIISLLLLYLKPYKGKLILAFLAMLIVSGTTLAGPYLIKVAVDDFIIPGNLQGLVYVFFIIIINYGLLWISHYWQGYISALIGQGVIKDIREAMYEKTLNLSMDFFSKKKTGQILSRITNDTDTLSEFVSSGIIHFFSDIFKLAGIIAIMFYFNVKLAIIVALIMPVIIIVLGYLGKKMRRAYREVRVKIAKLNEGVEENISGIRTVQAFSKEDENLGQFMLYSRENFRANLKAVSVLAVFFPVMDLSGVVGTGLVLWFGGLMFAAGEISLGVLAAFLTYVSIFFYPLRDLSQVYNTYQSAAASLERINDYLKMEPSVKPPHNPVKIKMINPEIECKGVSFKYGEDLVLKNINLKIKSGETMAVLGASGSGKTTLARLLARLYDVHDGEIAIDGVNIKNISFADLRSLLTVVPQEVHLFPGTIRDNIALGKSNATEDEIFSAAKSVMAHDFISELPDAYDTEVGEGGVRLSGGQKQLISFARAILADPKVLILDEVMSNVDTGTESKILSAMDTLFEDRTVIMITHRLATVSKADRIAVLEDGEVKGLGTHEELMADSDLYSGLYRGI